MKILAHVVFSIVLASAGLTAWAAEARKPTREEIEIRTDVATLKALPEEARASAIAALRLNLRAKDDLLAAKAIHARLVLLDLGDPYTIEDSLRHFRTDDNLRDRWRMEGLLEQTCQPMLVAELMKDVERDESVTLVDFGPEASDDPPSVVACRLICRLVQNIPDFDQSVKTWAAGLLRQMPAEMRGQIRRWWAQNKDSMLKANYGAVRPPAD